MSPDSHDLRFDDTQRIIWNMHEHVSRLSGRMDSVDEKLGRLADLLEKVISLESQQAAHAQTFDRLFQRIEKAQDEHKEYEEKIEALEKKNIHLETKIATATGITNAVWGFVSLVLVGSIGWLFAEFMDVRDRMIVYDTMFVKGLESSNSKHSLTQGDKKP